MTSPRLPGSFGPLACTFLIGFLPPLLSSCQSDAGSGDVPVQGWDVSGAYPVDRVARDAYPNFYSIFLAAWEEVEADSMGFVKLGTRVQEANPGGDLILARHIFHATEDRLLELSLEFSEEVDLFFNGWPVFSGRGPSETVDVPSGPAEATPTRIGLDVKKGLNEIFLMVAGRSPEWGFAIRTSGELPPKPKDYGATEELWITPDTFLTPESVLKDPNRDVLYVTNFDNEYGTRAEPSGYISTLSLQGEILEHRWVEGLHAPTGMDIWRDTLYVAERANLLAIALPSGAIAGRWAIPDPVFPNDLVIDDQGTVFISDTRSNDWAESRIYRFRGGEFDVFANEGISRANGLWIHDGHLLVGTSGDGLLQRVSLETGQIETVVSLGAGIIDGIRVDTRGNLIVSHWEGQVYRISPGGEVTEIFDALPQRWNTADFEYLPDQGILLIPTFLDNRVRAVRIAH